MKPLRVLLLMVEPPLPFGNSAARWFYVLLKGLVDRGHEVKAFAACSKREEIPKAQDLFPAPKYDLRCYPHPERGGVRSKVQTLARPYSYMFSDELKRDLQAEMAKGYDVLHLEQLWAAWLGLDDPSRALVNVHHLVWIDLEEVPPANWHERVTHFLMTHTERRLIRGMKHFRSCSPRLVPEILSENPKARITNIPVGMDLDQYRYIQDHERTQEAVISVIGNMSWYPTQSAAKRLLNRLWPEIKARVPNARVQLVGWYARTAMKDFLHLPDVTIVENVPEIYPYFQRTNVMVYAPNRGSGMKIKILEALGFGVPVVTTSEGAEGLPAQDGVHMGLCEDDAGLIERTVKLLQNVELQNKQRAHGRMLLENHCGPKVTLDALEGIYAQMIAKEDRT